MSERKMTEAEAVDFFATLFKGRHHIPGKLKPIANGYGWRVSGYVGDLGYSTYDSDYLTRAVFLAHDRCVRLSVLQSAPGHVAFEIFQRDPAGTAFHDHHPTLERAVAKWRERHPAPSDERSRLGRWRIVVTQTKASR